jgi:hypothetical protein
MQEYWYADHLDLIKWGILLQLADSLNARRILQLAFNPRPKEFDRLVIDGQNQDIPQEVIAHFRDLRKIGGLSTKVRVTVFDPPFNEKQRPRHCSMACAFVSAFSEERCVVFLDPDVGLEPQNEATLKHVLEKEAREIWEAMKAGDVFALFQHQTNMGGKPWLEPKQRQLARVLGVLPHAVRIAHALETRKGRKMEPKVVILYAERPHHLLETGCPS